MTKTQKHIYPVNTPRYGKTYSFVIPDIPKSINHAYIIRVNKRRAFKFMSKQGKEFVKLVHSIVSQHPECSNFPLTNKKYKVRITVYMNKNYRNDVDNFAKICLDSLNKTVIEDDFHINELSLKKQTSTTGEPYTIIDVIVLDYGEQNGNE